MPDLSMFDMTGKVADVDLILTDYQYTTGSGKNSTTHNLTVAAYCIPGLDLPDFALESENFLTRFAEKFGMQDIDFESHQTHMELSEFDVVFLRKDPPFDESYRDLCWE